MSDALAFYDVAALDTLVPGVVQSYSTVKARLQRMPGSRRQKSLCTTTADQWSLRCHTSVEVFNTQSRSGCLPSKLSVVNDALAFYDVAALGTLVPGVVQSYSRVKASRSSSTALHRHRNVHYSLHRQCAGPAAQRCIGKEGFSTALQS